MEAFVKLFRSRCEREQVQPSSLADKAIINAVASNNIDDLVKNHASQGFDRHLFQHRDVQAEHTQPAEQWPLLDVLGLQRAACQLCQTAPGHAGRGVLTCLPVLLWPAGEGQPHSNRVSAHFIIHQARVQWHHLPYLPPWDQRIPMTLRCLFLKLCIWVHLLVRHR